MRLEDSAADWTFNVNHDVWIRLTARGRRLARAQGCTVEEVDGWSRWQLWKVASVFGRHMEDGFDLLFKTEIQIRCGKDISRL
jgi:hypothetical protein